MRACWSRLATSMRERGGCCGAAVGGARPVRVSSIAASDIARRRVELEPEPEAPLAPRPEEPEPEAEPELEPRPKDELPAPPKLALGAD